MRKTFALLLCSVMLFAAACSNIPKPDAEVSVSDVNTSYELISRGFIQSVFTDDRELFEACFPASALEAMSEEDDPYDVFTSSIASVELGSFYGTEFSAVNDFTEEEGYDRSNMAENISVFHNVDEGSIGEIKLTKIRAYFESTEEAGRYVSIDLYMIVYETGGNWYYYELADSDAEFKA